MRDFNFSKQMTKLGIASLLVFSAGCMSVPTISVPQAPVEEGVRLAKIDQSTKAEACRLTGIELAANEKDEHAIAQLEQARKLDPRIQGVAHHLAVLYDRQGRMDAAQREYELAIRENSDEANIYNDYGYFLYAKGAYEQALEQLNQALKCDSRHSKAHTNLAMVYYSLGQGEKAFQHFEQAVGPAAAHHNIGLLELRNGNQHQAQAHLQKAALADPSLGSAELLASLETNERSTENPVSTVLYEQ